MRALCRGRVKWDNNRNGSRNLSFPAGFGGAGASIQENDGKDTRGDAETHHEIENLTGLCPDSDAARNVIHFGIAEGCRLVFLCESVYFCYGRTKHRCLLFQLFVPTHPIFVVVVDLGWTMVE